MESATVLFEGYVQARAARGTTYDEIIIHANSDEQAAIFETCLRDIMRVDNSYSRVTLCCPQDWQWSGDFLGSTVLAYRGNAIRASATLECRVLRGALYLELRGPDVVPVSELFEWLYLLEYLMIRFANMVEVCIEVVFPHMRDLHNLNPQWNTFVTTRRGKTFRLKRDTVVKANANAMYRHPDAKLPALAESTRRWLAARSSDKFPDRRMVVHVNDPTIAAMMDELRPYNGDIPHVYVIQTAAEAWLWTLLSNHQAAATNDHPGDESLHIVFTDDAIRCKQIVDRIIKHSRFSTFLRQYVHVRCVIYVIHR